MTDWLWSVNMKQWLADEGQPETENKTDDRRAGDADKLALHDSLVVPLTEVLTDKRDDRLIERVHRDIYKTLEVRGGGVSGHDVGSELVDGRLNDDVREGEQRSLKSRRKTDSDDLTEL